LRFTIAYKRLTYSDGNRGHGGLRKEIKVRTPYEALEYWYNLKPDLFIRKPDMLWHSLNTLQWFY
jgi:hypothetical protein